MMALFFDADSYIKLSSIAKYVRGMYAVRVKGHIPDDVEQELNERGIRYRKRDQTEQD